MADENRAVRVVPFAPGLNVLVQMSSTTSPLLRNSRAAVLNSRPRAGNATAIRNGDRSSRCLRILARAVDGAGHEDLPNSGVHLGERGRIGSGLGFLHLNLTPAADDAVGDPPASNDIALGGERKRVRCGEELD